MATRVALIAALVFACAALAPAFAKPTAIPAWVRWDYKDEAPKTYRIDGLTLKTSLERRKNGRVAVLTVSAPGMKPILAKGDENSSPLSLPGEFVVLQLAPRQPPIVLFRTFTGGAHCCLSYQLIRTVSGRWLVNPIGEWDDSAAPDPADFDHDGRVEFVGRDQRFQYEFDSYAASVSPVVIYDLRGAGFVDVSDSPRYRAAHRAQLGKYRKWCEDTGENGPCAGYVAQAARAGEAKAAFAVLDRNVGRAEFKGPFQVPLKCGGSALEGNCKSQPQRSFPTLHEAVAWFLRDLEYLRGSGA